MKKPKSIKSSWYLWLFPLVALAISGYYLYDYFAQEGPRISIYFEDASSVQAEKTTVRYRGVSVGLVKDVSISDDQKQVEVEVLLRKDAKSFAVEGTKFAIVKPKVGFQGISGLETLIEGTYISVEPGPAKNPPRKEFRAQALPAIETPDDISSYIIESPSVESLSVGDFVTYRGMRVGTLSKMSFQKGARMVNVQINIENRYTHLIRENTVFWRKIGVQAKFGLFGSNIKVNSIDSIMNGALEFATPNTPGAKAKNLRKFTLQPGAPKDLARWNPELD